MTPQLQSSIDNLYQVFYKYPFRSNMQGCPCCVDDSHKRELCAAPLKKLSEDQLSMFTHKALTTWGEVEDFKHFLPRIFELMATSEFAADVTTLYKLAYGKWDTWDETEKDAVRQFLLAWWADVATRKNWFNKELFMEALKRTSDIKLLLQSWVITEKDNSIRNINNFIQYHFIDVIKPAYLFKQMEQADRLYFIKWINRQIPVLENAFFHFEKKDPEFAQEISNALYILEHTTVDIWPIEENRSQ